MNVVAFVFARGGSKGLPGKNVRPLGGKPLIGWSIEQARAVPRVSRVIVSTDCPEIAAVARAHGAETPFLRPPELAHDDSPEWQAWRHALAQLRDEVGELPDAMLSVPTTSPLREPGDLERCLDAFAPGDVDAVITVTEARRSPYFNMVRSAENDTVSLVIPPTGKVARRQDAPVVFDITTVGYVLRPSFVFEHNALFEGRVRAVQVPLERAADIDTELDFELAEFLFHRQRGAS